MKLSLASLHAYLFFYIGELSQKQIKDLSNTISAYYIRHYKLKPQKFDLKHPSLEVLYSGQTGEFSVGGMALCIFTFHDIALAVFQLLQHPKETSPVKFWQEKRTLLNLPEILEELQEKSELRKWYFGTTYAYLSQIDEFLSEDFHTIVEQLNITPAPKIKTTEICSYGILSLIAEQQTDISLQKHYLLLADNKQKYEDATLFFDRDFVLLDSFQRKLSFEELRVGKIRNENKQYSDQLSFILQRKTKLGDIDQQLDKMKTIQNTLWKSLSKLRYHDHTVAINIINLRNYISRLPIELDKDDMLFHPVLQNYIRLKQQLRYDMGYLQISLEKTDREVKNLELRIEGWRAEHERIIERLIAVLGVAIGAGQIAQGAARWLQSLVMVGSGVITFFILPKLIGYFEYLKRSHNEEMDSNNREIKKTLDV